MSIINECSFDGFFFHHSLDKSPDSNLFNMHTHNLYEIFLFISGDCEYVIEGTTYKLEPYTLLIMRPMEFHKLNINSTNTYERIVLQFSDSFIKNLDTEGMLLKPFNSRDLGKNNFIPLKNIYKSQILDSFKLIETINLNDNYLQYLSCTSNTVNILLIIYNAFSSMPHEIKKNTPNLIDKIITYINENLSSNITLNDLEKEFFMNKFYLNRMFQKTTGSTIGNYIIKKRLLLAQQLLQTGYTPANACKSSGFGDYSNFYRAYIKNFGISPQQETSKP